MTAPTRANEEVRDAGPMDAFALAAISIRAWGTRNLRDLAVSPISEIERTWQNSLQDPPSPRHRALVALSNGVVVGFAAITPLSQSVDEIVEFLIDPALTQRGHGSRLMNAIVDTCPTEVAGMSIWSDLGELDAFLLSCGWGKSDQTRTLSSGDLTIIQHHWVTSLRHYESPTPGANT